MQSRASDKEMCSALPLILSGLEATDTAVNLRGLMEHGGAL